MPALHAHKQQSVQQSTEARLTEHKTTRLTKTHTHGSHPTCASANHTVTNRAASGRPRRNRHASGRCAQTAGTLQAIYHIQPFQRLRRQAVELLAVCVHLRIGKKALKDTDMAAAIVQHACAQKGLTDMTQLQRQVKRAWRCGIAGGPVLAITSKHAKTCLADEEEAVERAVEAVERAVVRRGHKDDMRMQGRKCLLSHGAIPGGKSLPG